MKDIIEKAKELEKKYVAENGYHRSIMMFDFILGWLSAKEPIIRIKCLHCKQDMDACVRQGGPCGD